MRSLSILPVLLLGALALVPGCALFVIGGTAAALLALDEGEEKQTSPIVQITAPGRLTANPALVTYTLIDAEGDPCDLVVEYSVGGGAFHPAVAGTGGEGAVGLSSDPAGVGHVFSLDFSAGPDLTPPETLDVTIRMTAVDATGRTAVAQSSAHTLGDAPPAVLSVTAPSGDVTGTVVVQYAIADAHGDSATLEVQFKRESDGTDWALAGHDATPDATPASLALQNISTLAGGAIHLFPWDSDGLSDMQGENADVRLRIRASDASGLWGSWVETAAVVRVRNDEAPRVQIGAVDANQGGIVYLPYTCFDAEGHAVSLLAEYQEIGESVWKRASLAQGSSFPFFAAAPEPGGTPGVVAWDSRRDGIQSRGVTVRLVPSEPNLLGLAATANIAVGNDATDTWTVRAPVPTGRRFHACVSIDGIVYVLGGYTPAMSASVEAYDPGTDTWATKADMPAANAGFGAEVVNGRIYTFGGEGPTAAVHEYDPAADTWAARAPMPTARRWFANAVLGGKIYVLGGIVMSSPGLNLVEEYTPGADTWAVKTPMNLGRYNFAAAAASGRIYATGGWSTASVEAFDPNQGAGGAWTYRASMAAARREHAATAVGNKVYVFGGFVGTISNAVEEYDITTNTWIPMTSMFFGRRFLASACVGGKIFVTGGEGGTTANHMYDPPADGWRSETPLPSARNGSACVALGGLLYCIGGGSPSALATVQRYDPATGVWSNMTSMTYARDNPCAAAVNGKIYVFGGYGSGWVAPVEEYDPLAGAGGSWTVKGNMVVPRGYAGAAVVGGKVYIVGGYNYSTVDRLDRYDPATDQWASGFNPPPTPTYAAACAVGGGKIYYIGGQNGLTVNREYDVASDTWRLAPSMPTPRRAPQAVEVGGKVLVLGGDNYYSPVQRAVEEFDPYAQRWTSRPLMPIMRTYFGCAVAGGRVFAVGGDSPSMTATVDSYYLAKAALVRNLETMPLESAGGVLFPLPGEVMRASGTTAASAASNDARSSPLVEDIPAAGPFTINPVWAARPAMATARRDACAAAYGGRGYVVGGFDGAGMPLASFECFDPSSNAWAALDDMPTARGGAGCARIGDRIYVVGGEAGLVKRTTLEAYDLAAGSWVTGLASMPTQRSHMGCASLGGLLYAVGGEGAGNAFSAAVERYDPAQDAWTVLGALPAGTKGPLLLEECGRLRLFGGEVYHPSASNVMTDLILTFQPADDAWTGEAVQLPYAARGLLGCTVTHSWTHRGTTQTDEFCLIAGGFDGSGVRDGFFRFTTR